MPRHLSCLLPRLVQRLLPRAVLVAAMVSAVGCYHYAATPFDQLRVGMEVRAKLSGMAVERMRDGAESVGGLVDAFTVSGRVLQLNRDTLVVSVPRTIFEGDYRTHVLTQNVLLRRADVVGTELKRLDRTKTTMVAVGAGIAAFLFVQASRRGAGHTGSIPVLGGPPELRRPVARGWLFR